MSSTKDPVFKANPSLNIYYKTSDGQPFLSENGARNHIKAHKLKNNSIDTVKRTVEHDEELTEEAQLVKSISKMTVSEIETELTALEIEVPEGNKQEKVDALVSAKMQNA